MKPKKTPDPAPITPKKRPGRPKRITPLSFLDDLDERRLENARRSTKNGTRPPKESLEPIPEALIKVLAERALHERLLKEEYKAKGIPYRRPPGTKLTLDERLDTIEDWITRGLIKADLSSNGHGDFAALLRVWQENAKIRGQISGEYNPAGDKQAAPQQQNNTVVQFFGIPGMVSAEEAQRILSDSGIGALGSEKALNAPEKLRTLEETLGPVDLEPKEIDGVLVFESE